jgi:hypothetical protein
MFAMKLSSLKLDIADVHSKDKGIKRRGWTADISHQATVLIYDLNYAFVSSDPYSYENDTALLCSMCVGITSCIIR